MVMDNNAQEEEVYGSGAWTLEEIFRDLFPIDIDNSAGITGLKRAGALLARYNHTASYEAARASRLLREAEDALKIARESAMERVLQEEAKKEKKKAEPKKEQMMHACNGGYRLRIAAVGTVLAALIATGGCGGGKPADVRHHEQGLIYLQQTRDYEKAIREFNQALSANPNRPDTIYYLGRAYIFAQRYDEALKHLAAARALVDTWPPSRERDRKLAALYRRTAEAYEPKGEYQLALSWLERGLSLPGVKGRVEEAFLKFGGAAVYHRRGENELAVEWCRQGLGIAGQVEGREGQEALARGKQEGKVVLIEVYDEVCPYCQRMLDTWEDEGV